MEGFFFAFLLMLVVVPCSLWLVVKGVAAAFSKNARDDFRQRPLLHSFLAFSFALVVVATTLGIRFVSAGPGITRISGVNFDAALLKEISYRTGIQFPEGTRGIEYYHEAEFRDDAFATKITVPNEKREEFLQNPIFRDGKNELPQVAVGKKEKWWRLDDLTGQIDRTIILPRAVVGCTLGIETGTLVAYISCWKY